MAAVEWVSYPTAFVKTMLVKAIAHETQCTFLPVECSDVNDKYFGEAEKAIRQPGGRGETAVLALALLGSEHYSVYALKAAVGTKTGADDQGLREASIQHLSRLSISGPDSTLLAPSRKAEEGTEEGIS